MAVAQPQPPRAIAQGPVSVLLQCSLIGACPIRGVLRAPQGVVVAQTTTTSGGSLYPSLNDEYMGLQLTQYVPPGAVVPASQSTAMVAPVSGAGNVGLRRAEIKQGE